MYEKKKLYKMKIFIVFHLFFLYTELLYINAPYKKQQTQFFSGF